MNHYIGQQVVITNSNTEGIKFLLRGHTCRIKKMFAGEASFYDSDSRRNHEYVYRLEWRQEDNPGRDEPYNTAVFTWFDTDFVVSAVARDSLNAFKILPNI